MKGSIDATATVTKDDASNTLKASVAYGDKKSFTNKLVTASIPPTPPTVDKPELKLYNIQLHKANADGNALAGAVFPGFLGQMELLQSLTHMVKVKQLLPQMQNRSCILHLDLKRKIMW